MNRWHPTRPTNPADKSGIDHVVLAFAMANNTAAFQPKVPVSTIRSEFPGAKVMIAIGGWGDTVGFTEATRTDAGIQKFAYDVKTMLTNTGADGVGKFQIPLLPLLTCPLLTKSRYRLGVPWRQRRRLQTSAQLGQSPRNPRLP